MYHFAHAAGHNNESTPMLLIVAINRYYKFAEYTGRISRNGQYDLELCEFGMFAKWTMENFQTANWKQIEKYIIYTCGEWIAISAFIHI